jgi:flavodoxin
VKLLYGTVGGTTRRVAKRLQAVFGGACTLWSAEQLLADGAAFTPEDLIVCSPTYGDGELEATLERALVGHGWGGWGGHRVAFCEVGIYTGYEDFGHGLLPILRMHFAAAGMVEAFAPLSLDSVPLEDGGLVERWGEDLARAWSRPRG